jgi:hypothetical protein
MTAIAAYLAFGGVIWLLLETICGPARTAYLRAIDSGRPVWACRGGAVAGSLFIIVVWPFVYGMVVVDACRALWRMK